MCTTSPLVARSKRADGGPVGPTAPIHDAPKYLGRLSENLAVEVSTLCGTIENGTSTKCATNTHTTPTGHWNDYTTKAIQVTALIHPWRELILQQASKKQIRNSLNTFLFLFTSHLSPNPPFFSLHPYAAASPAHHQWCSSPTGSCPTCGSPLLQ